MIYLGDISVYGLMSFLCLACGSLTLLVIIDVFGITIKVLINHIAFSPAFESIHALISTLVYFSDCPSSVSPSLLLLFLLYDLVIVISTVDR